MTKSTVDCRLENSHSYWH